MTDFVASRNTQLAPPTSGRITENFKGVKPPPADPYPRSLEQGRLLTWRILSKPNREYAVRQALVGEVAANRGGCGSHAIVVARKIPSFSQTFCHARPDGSLTAGRWLADLNTKWVVQQYVVEAKCATTLFGLPRIERSDCAARVLWAVLIDHQYSWLYRETFAVLANADAGFVLLNSDCVATQNSWARQL